MRKIYLSKVCILYCLVSLNSILLLTLFVSIQYKVGLYIAVPIIFHVPVQYITSLTFTFHLMLVFLY